MILQLNRVTVLLLTAFTTYFTSDISLADVSLTLSGECQVDFSRNCEKDVSNYLQTVKSILETQINTSVMTDAKIIQNDLFYGSNLLNANKHWLSTLVTTVNTSININLTVQNLEVRILITGIEYKKKSIASQLIRSQLITSHATMDIDLLGVSENNKDSAAVVFMSYTNMTHILEPRFFKTVTHTKKTTIMSTVVSVTLPKTTNKDLTKPVSFTFKHITELDPEAFLSCMDWETNTWDTCFLTQTSSTYSVCSCNRMTTLALISQTDPCRDTLTIGQCSMDFLNQIKHNIVSELPQETVKRYLTTIMNLTTCVKNQHEVRSYGNVLMNVTEKLSSALVKKTDTYNSSSISLQMLEVQVFMIGPKSPLRKIPPLFTSYASMVIDLIGISKKNTGSAAVAFISYTNMADILENTYFNAFTDTKKSIMSMVVSVTLPKTTNTELTAPVNFTFKHINELAHENILSCMYWDENRWYANYCNITETNSSHTVCSCNRLGTFALLMQTDPCMGYLTGPCAIDFLYQIPDNIPQELPQEIGKNYFNIIMSLTTQVIDDVSDKKYLISYGNALLKTNEKLVSNLMRKRDTYSSLNLSVQNFEVQVCMIIGPNVSLREIPQLSTTNASIDFDLVGISKNSKGSAAVIFMSYTNLANILKPTFFKTITNTKKIIMSTVVLASVTTIMDLTKPVNLTLKHISELDPEGILSCVYWKTNSWHADGCSIIQTNSSHTICTCDHLSTFALIMQTDPCRSDRLMNTLIAVAIIVGLVFLSLSILTFTFYSWNPVTNAALINLCINLLLFHLLSLIKTLFLAHIHPQQLRAALAGVQYFLLMSVFVWMLIEAVLLYIFVKNLSKFRSNQGEGLSWKWLIAFGYLIPLGVLGASAVRFPKGYIDEECWLNEDGSLIFIFAGPLIFTVTVNLIPYLIIIMMIFIFKRLKNEILQMSSTADENFIMCVTFRSLTQFIILVCYWILLYIPSKNGILYHAFQFLNSQQGTFIFLVHCLLDQEVRQKYRKVLCAFCVLTTSRCVRGQPKDSQDN